MFAAAALTFVLTAALYGRLELGRDFPLTSFDRGHFRVYEAILGGRGGLVATDVAFPVGGLARYMGWVGVAITGMLQPIFGPLGAYVLATWAGPALGAALAVPLLRAVTRADLPTAVLLSPIAALSPVVVGFLRCGQTAKSHVWTLELAILCVWAGMAHARARWPLLAVAAASMLVGFQAPPLALVLPFAVAVPVVAAVAAAPRPARRAAILRGGALLAAVAAGLMAPTAYTGSGVPPSGSGPVVQRAADAPIYLMIPAQNADASMGGIATPSVAEPIGMFVGPTPDTTTPDASIHVTYVGVPALILALVCARRRGRGWAFGAALTSLGITIAIGPYLGWGSAYIVVADRLLPGPAFLLRAVGYPLNASGLWYRALVLVGPGLAVLSASAVATLPSRRARLAAGAATLLVLGDTLRATAPLLPIPSAPVEGRELLARITADTTPGAVLELPLERAARNAESALLRTALHGRTSSVMPHHTLFAIHPHLRALDMRLRAALATSDPAAALRAAGFAWVILDTLAGPPPMPNHAPASPMALTPGVTEAALTQALGPPTTTSTLRAWSLAPR